MSINSINGQNAASAYIQNADITRTANAAQQQAPKTHHHHAASAARTADEVTLSDSARSLASAQDAVRSAPEIRDQKVAAIKQQIESGTYQVSAQVLARKMVNAANSQTL
jgi:negative regulator of flagellin synthesis FlgM